MENRYYSLKIRQVCFIYLAFMPIAKLFVLPSILAGISAQDMWISTIISLSIEFLTFFGLITLLKNADKDIYTLLQETFGKVGSKIILSLFLILFLTKSILPIIEQKDYIEQTLYITRPHALIFFIFFAVSIYLSYKTLRVIGRCGDMFFLFTLIGLILLALLSIPNFDLGAICPVGKSGIGKIVKGAYAGMPWYADAVYFLFFVGEIKPEKRANLKLIISFIASALLVLLFIFLFYSAFSSIAHRQRFALTEISKYTAVINNVGRIDYLNIFSILSSGIISACLPLFFSAKISEKLIGIKKPIINALLVSLIPFIFTMFFDRYVFIFEFFMSTYFAGYILIIGNLLPIIIATVINRYITNQKIIGNLLPNGVKNAN